MTDPDTPILPGPDTQGALDRRYEVRIASRLQSQLGFSSIEEGVVFLSDQLGLDDIQNALAALDARVTALES